MTWDIREMVLVVKWRSEGHEVRPFGSPGMAVCLRCSTIIHVRRRAQALANDTHWDGGADIVKPCKGDTE